MSSPPSPKTSLWPVLLLVVSSLVMAACAEQEARVTADGDDDPAQDTEASSGVEGETTALDVGYVHTVAVDSHMWLALERGYFADEGLKINPNQFDSSIGLSQALAGGSVDLAGMGAAISNFPAQRQGTAVLANNIEAGTAQIWVDPEAGIESVEDLAGREVATTQGTTAHVLLQVAMDDVGLHSDDVELVNREMPTAVDAFVSGSVPALVTRSPFNAQIEENRPEAELLTTAREYLPETAILNGWVASNDLMEQNPEEVDAFTRAWLRANEDIVSNPDEAMATVHEAGYGENLELADVQRMYDETRWHRNDEWAELYRDGDVAEWLGQINEVYVEIGAFDEPIPPEEFFQPDIFLDAYEERSS